jgi:hypothetical protein
MAAKKKRLEQKGKNERAKARAKSERAEPKLENKFFPFS